MPGSREIESSNTRFSARMTVGIVAALLSLGIGELLAAVFAPRPGPVTAVASRVIDIAPNWFIDFGKAVFQLADKPALVIGTIIITVVLAALLNGFIKRVSFWLPAFFIISFISIGTDSMAGWFYALVLSTATTFVAGLVLRRGNSQQGGDVSDSEMQESWTASRRSFFVTAAGGLALAGVAAISANIVRGWQAVDEKRKTIFLRDPINSEIQDAVDRVVDSDINQTAGLTEYVVPAEDFYLIDTAIVKPQVDVETWSLTIKGLVDNEVTYTYDQLLERATTVAPVTLSCVSNPVGGDLVGNAVWQGVPLAELLDEAGVQPEAEQLASRSVDGWTCGFPVERAFDGRTALLAVGMNGEPLTVDHGYPARLVISGLYGYVSATKWIEEINLTTWEGFDGFWIPRGWSKLGPVKLQSRIDTPTFNQAFQGQDSVPIAGIAWAPNTGVAKVEVKVGSDEWREAELGDVPEVDAEISNASIDTWIQWRFDWIPNQTGIVIVQVRATDAEGNTQTDELADVAPDGATGWHQIRIQA